MDLKILLSKDEYKDLITYCELNNFQKEEIIKKSYVTGFNIEKYGLLNPKNEIVEKEIIKEVPVEKIVEVPIDRIHEKVIEIIKEVPVIKEIIKEVPSPPIEVEVIKYVDREVVKEVFVENDVSNLDNIWDKQYVNSLNERIKELENRPVEIKEIVKEVPVEVIKEVIIEKSDDILKNRLSSLQNTLHNLRQENIDKEKKLKECENMVEELKKFNNDKGAVYLNRSNLDDKLYK
jgi:hypothetical protein